MAAGGHDVIAAPPLAAIVDSFRDGVRFIFEARDSRAGPGVQVGGLDEMSTLTGNHFAVSFVAVAIAVVISVPLGLWLGHLGRAEFLTISVANIGRAVPALAIIGLTVAFLGQGFTNVAFALTLLAIPPILTNTYVGVRQVDRELVDAARGQGLHESQIVRQVELPLALPTIFGGVRISAVTVLATAIIAPLAGYQTLGEPIISVNVYTEAGQLGAAILVAVLTLGTDGGFAVLQRLVTPKGLKLGGRPRRRTWPIPLTRRSVQSS